MNDNQNISAEKKLIDLLFVSKYKQLEKTVIEMKNGKDAAELMFGKIDTSTGLVQEGYVENGEMKFKKIPWYKRLFSKEPSEIKYLGTITLYWNFFWSNKKNYFEAAVYKKYNPYTGKIQCIYANVPNRGAMYFDVKAYEKSGQLVERG